jgi:drug/metabolite transporter (DMT)-like permease
MKNNTLKGALLVTLGACCYGMLGTYVKMAYLAGFNTAEVTISQFSFGFVGLFILALFSRQEQPAAGRLPSIKSKIRLVVAGTSLGLTSIFYYLSVKYIAVSVAIVLLAQAVWMGVLLEAIISRRMPGISKILPVLVIMIGTVLATDVLRQSIRLNWKGFAYGAMGALCYTATMYSTNHLDIHFPPLKRSLYMILGGFIIILLVFRAYINREFSYRIFVSWGLAVSLFGTILPPLLFTRGMPLAGMGLGAILVSIEIPVSVITANMLLDERVVMGQWIGVVLILGAVVLINMPKRKFLKQNI